MIVSRVDRGHFRRDEHRKCELLVEERGRGTKPPKRYRTVEEKRRIVEEALLPGASIARGASARREREPSLWLAATLKSRCLDIGVLSRFTS